MTLYLFTEPVDETLQEFMDLGQQLRALGRFFDKRRACMSGPLQWLDAHAAPRVLIAPEALPYRPNRGVYVFVEEPQHRRRRRGVRRVGAAVARDDVDAWLAVPGVAGCWSFATARGCATPAGARATAASPSCYLDDDPLDGGGEAVRPLLETRWQDAAGDPVHAGPYETVVPYQWDWFD